MKSLAVLLIWLIFTLSGFAQTTDTFTSSGTWTAPVGVTSVNAECWGSGAGGSGFIHGRISHPGSGGGGGAYAEANAVSVVPGTTYAVIVGVGGFGGAFGLAGGDGSPSYFIDALTVMALGGQGGPFFGQTALGGSAVLSIGDITYSGGNGTGGANQVLGGGGGGGAGQLADGGDAGVNPTAGAGGVTDGGNGGDGASSSGLAVAGFTIGGGGGGGWTFATSGASGARGEVRITY